MEHVGLIVEKWHDSNQTQLGWLKGVEQKKDSRFDQNNRQRYSMVVGWYIQWEHSMVDQYSQRKYSVVVGWHIPLLYSKVVALYNQKKNLKIVLYTRMKYL